MNRKRAEIKAAADAVAAKYAAEKEQEPCNETCTMGVGAEMCSQCCERERVYMAGLETALDEFAALEAERDELREAWENARFACLRAEAERDEWKRRAEEAEYGAETARLIEGYNMSVCRETPTGTWLAGRWDRPVPDAGLPLGEAVRAAAGVGEGGESNG